MHSLKKKHLKFMCCLFQESSSQCLQIAVDYRLLKLLKEQPQLSREVGTTPVANIFNFHGPCSQMSE